MAGRRDAGVALRISIDGSLLLVVAANIAADAAGLVDDLLLDGALVGTSLLLAVLVLLVLGHADEPVESEGGDDVEDDVSPEDT